MLYQALYIPPGHPALPRQVVRLPELARYVQDWGQNSDFGFLASEAMTDQSMGAVWGRLLIGDNQGYGYVNDETYELSIAVLPEYRGQGIGTRLLAHLFESEYGERPMSLSVSVDNPAVRLYQRFGFEVVSQNDASITMTRN